MLRETGPVGLVRQAAVEAVEAAKPVHLLFGTVVSARPLKIQADQKAVYTERMLTLARAVTDFDVSVTLPSAAGEEGSRGRLRVHNALAVGERVLLARMQRGRRFVVLGRLSPGAGDGEERA